jgi:crossover junction endodeoxyribonuclease RuvC
MNKERIILGIDPGTTIMGFGLIKVVGKKMVFLQLNELNLKKYDDHYLKLKLIFERTIELIDTHHPDEIAIEAPFFGKNVQSMLKLGRAQGVAMAAGLSRQIPITELDSTDGLAAAVCHFYNSGKITVGKSYSGWESFVKQNPKKIS